MKNNLDGWKDLSPAMDFFSYLGFIKSRTPETIVAKSILLAGIVIGCLSIYEKVFNNPNLSQLHYEKIIIALNIGAILGFYGFHFFNYTKDQKLKICKTKVVEIFIKDGKLKSDTILNIALKSISQLRFIWLCLISIWFLYYFFKLFKNPIFISSQITEIIQFSIYNILNNISSFFVLLLYILLAFRTYDEVDNTNRFRNLIIFPIVIFLAIIGAEVILKYHFVVDNIDQLKNGTYTSSINNDSINIFFTSLSALIASLTFVLLVGRLDSTYINPPKVLIVLLYSYAFIMIIYPSINMFHAYIDNDVFDNPNLKILYFGFMTKSMILVALVCKVTLYLLLYWAIRTEKMFTYFIFMRTSPPMVDRVKSIIYKEIYKEEEEKEKK